MIKNSRPTVRGAVVEVLLVLAVGIAVVGIYRGWFTNSAGNRIRRMSNDNVQSTAPIAAAKVDSEVVW